MKRKEKKNQHVSGLKCTPTLCPICKDEPHKTGDIESGVTFIECDTCGYYGYIG